MSTIDYGLYMYKNEIALVTGDPKDLLVRWLESELLLQVSILYIK